MSEPGWRLMAWVDQTAHAFTKSTPEGADVSMGSGNDFSDHILTASHPTCARFSCKLTTASCFPRSCLESGFCTRSKAHIFILSAWQRSCKSATCVRSTQSSFHVGAKTCKRLWRFSCRIGSRSAQRWKLVSLKSESCVCDGLRSQVSSLPLPDDHKICTKACSRAFVSAATSIHL